jgi:hypothetical protein
MQTATRSSTLIQHTLTLLLGALLAVVIWLAGYADVSWLGFVAAAMHADSPSGRRRLARVARRSTH